MNRHRQTPEAGRPTSPRLRARRRLRRLAFVLVALTILGVLGAGITYYAKGYRVWVVHTGSMEPTYMPGDLIVDRPPTGHYRPGQVLTFRHSDLTTDVVTHRVTAVTPSGLIHTKGDANRTADVWQIRPDQVQGSVMFRVKALGYLLVFLRQPTGAAATLALVVALVLLWQLFFAGTGREVTDPDPSADKGESLPDLDIPERVARR